VEHRLQLRRGQQTHRLPDADEDLQVLERAMRDRRSHAAQPLRLVDSVRERMVAVADIYARIIHSQQPPREEAAAFQLRSLPAQMGRDQSYNQILHRLAADAPALYEIATRRELSTHARRNLHRFLSAAFTSSERYAAVVRDPRAVEHALRLFKASDYLTDILVRHPVEIATITEIAEQPSLPGQEDALLAEAEVQAGPSDPVLRHVVEVDALYTEKLALLRQHYRHRVFAAGARDLMELRPVYDSLEEMTRIADDAIATATAIAGAQDTLAVLALGRLGSREFDLASDADLLFVRDEASDPAAARKAAEQMVEALAAYTREGTVFAVDPRLRPRGTEGELVSTPSGLAAYFSTEAQAWEALTYTKLRFVAGSTTLGQRAVAAVHEQLKRFTADPDFPHQVGEMRTRLEASSDRSNFKTSPGGFYDIDFAVSYLLVRQGAFEVAGSIREKLYALEERGLLDVNAFATLDSAAELLRTLEHVVRIVVGRPRKSLPVAEQARETTERLTARFLGREFPGGLESELARSGQSVRQVYEQMLGRPAPAL
jgi:glutamate-ammonia-ligase adenylyltransferase